MQSNTLRFVIVRPTLQHLGMWSEEAEELMMGTLAQESTMGKHYRQIGGGPALGFFQVEPKTEACVWDNYLAFRPELRNKILELVNLSPNADEPLISNPMYACAIARCVYVRRPEPIPKTLEGQAEYWKQWYNTALGKGTVEEYLHSYKQLVQVS